MVDEDWSTASNCRGLLKFGRLHFGLDVPNANLFLFLTSGSDLWVVLGLILISATLTQLSLVTLQITVLSSGGGCVATDATFSRWMHPKWGPGSSGPGLEPMSDKLRPSSSHHHFSQFRFFSANLFILFLLVHSFCQAPLYNAYWRRVRLSI